MPSSCADAFVPLLVQCMRKEHNIDIMILAARALTHLMEALPSSCNTVVAAGAVKVFCEKLLAIEFIDLAEQVRAPPPPPPMALCDIHVAGCGEHLPAWGLCDDRIPGTDQAVRGGRHGQKLHSGSPPPPQGRGMPAAVRMPVCHSRRFKGERPIGAATG